jgi:4-amino-4-deoxy-L-arabinose transferase-like glycosyltransferase
MTPDPASPEATDAPAGSAAPPASKGGFFGILLLLAVALLVGTAGWGDLYNETDGQYGGAAKVMAEGGSWLVPENNGIPRLVKPPLLYWEMAAAMKIFGVGPFAARLPGALALVALTVVTALIGRQIGGPGRGALAGVILLTSLGLYSLGRIVMPEQTLSAFIAASLYCVLRGQADPGRRRIWFLAFWVCASLASFVKGWHGTLYPLVIVGVAAAFCREARASLRGLISWEGPAVFVLINLPWYLAIEARFPGWFHNLIFTEHLGHIEGNSTPATDYTSVPRWQFILLHLAWFFPWSLVAGMALLTRRRLPGSRPPTPRFATALIWAWAGVIFGSVLLTGQRQDYYAMSMWPAFALGAAWVLERYSVRPGLFALAGVLGAGLIGSLFLGTAAPVTETETLAARATAWTTVMGFDPGVWKSLQATAWFALGGGWLGAVAALVFSKNPWPGLVAGAACLALGAVNGTAVVSPYFSLARMAPFLPSGATVVYDGGIDTGSSLLVYADVKILVLDQNPDEEFPVRRFGLGRDRFVTTDELIARWKSGEPLYLVTESRRLGEWREALGGAPDPVARCGTSILLKR